MVFLWDIKKLIHSINNNLNYNKIYTIFLYVLIGGFAVATYQRNEIWRTNINLWEDTIKKSPDSGYIHLIYGNSLMKKNNKGKAKEEFNKAMVLGEKSSAYFLGLLSLEEGNYEVAERNFLSITNSHTLSLNTPSRASESFEKLADLYINNISEFSQERQGYVLRIIDYYKKINTKENNSEFLFKIGQLYFRIRYYHEAKRFLEKIIREDSGGIFVSSAHEIINKIKVLQEAGPVRQGKP